MAVFTVPEHCTSGGLTPVSENLRLARGAIGIVKALTACACAFVLSAGTALAAEPTLVSRDLPPTGGRVPAGAAAPDRFNMVGLHWQGPGRVFFRVHRVDGGWSRWRAAAPDPEDLPDTGSREAVRLRGWRLGNPYWTGASNRIEYRVAGRVTRLRAHFVWSPVERVPLRRLAAAGSPGVLPRASWQASEGIRRSGPRYAAAVRFAVVHHTAGTNAYGPAESAAIVRGIQLYHVRGNGWSDIGYNFLVDRYGQVFEGRYGGMTRNVIGAHAEGFNTGSVGVSVLGTYSGTSISPQARAALVKLLAWRLDVAHVDPLSPLTWASGGNARFSGGRPVFLRTISGHRDTGFTSCPGDAFYRDLGKIAGSVATSGLPKLYFPRVRGGVGGAVRFTARLSSALSWTVTVRDAAGQRVAGGTGRSAAVDWTWDARGAGRGPYSYSFEAGPAVRSVRGTIGRSGTTSPVPPPTALLSGLLVFPPSVTPNGDGVNDTTTVSYTLAAPALVTAVLTDSLGRPVTTLFNARRETGRRSFTLTADEMPDGTYTVILTAQADDGRVVTEQAAVLVSRVVRSLAVTPAVFSPNGDGRFERIRFTFELLGPAEVTLRIVGGGITVASPFTGPLPVGLNELSWDGRLVGARLPDGRYDGVLTIADALTSFSQTLRFTSDTTAPRLARLSGRRVWVSEGALVTMTGPAGFRTSIRLANAGSVVVPSPPVSGRVRVVAVDPVGNVSSALSLP